ncbi:hypothetical protein BCR35DRAFT_336576 [Leucosporidium creatinivorum]|uniref:Uncharacterized protein n=1 Tax=Leucosporidium creatinivorum TaxID=106004 RepID=A0A1Y2BU90_9BASI|nr:hypothetical protein BCR35DRAFT_336576 [Leucosporidium creatinivorum]
MVSYRMEITLKRKGWSKGTEKIALPLPYPIESENPYGEPLLLVPDLGTALVVAHRHPLSTWPSSTFGQEKLAVLPADFAQLSHWRAALPSTLFLSWHFTIHLPRREADNLARLINAGALEVFAGRRITPFISGKGEGGLSRMFKTSSKGAGRRQATVVAGESPVLGLLDVGGWIELAKEDMKAFSSCNGRVQHFVVVQLPSLRGEPPLVLEAELVSSPAAAQDSVDDLRTGNERLTLPEEAYDRPSSLRYLHEDDGNPSLRPKRPDPPSIISTESSSIHSGGIKRSTSLSLDLGSRPLPRSPSRRNSFSQASRWSSEAEKSAFSAAISRRRTEREAKAAREEEEQKEAKARAAKAAATRTKADSTGRHLPYAGFFMV